MRSPCRGPPFVGAAAPGGRVFGRFRTGPRCEPDPRLTQLEDFARFQWLPLDRVPVELRAPRAPRIDEYDRIFGHLQPAVHARGTGIGHLDVAILAPAQDDGRSGSSSTGALFRARL